MKNLPDWLVASFRVALLGEIYPQIRAIAVGYNDQKELLLRYYIDREPTEFDRESLEIVAINLDATVLENQLSKLDVECVYSSDLPKDLDALSGFVYARREG